LNQPVERDLRGDGSTREDHQRQRARNHRGPFNDAR
jgi:hypothetical protein